MTELVLGSFEQLIRFNCVDPIDNIYINKYHKQLCAYNT